MYFLNHGYELGYWWSRFKLDRDAQRARVTESDFIAAAKRRCEQLADAYMSSSNWVIHYADMHGGATLQKCLDERSLIVMKVDLTIEWLEGHLKGRQFRKKTTRLMLCPPLRRNNHGL